MFASVRGRSRMNSSRQTTLATRSAQPWSSGSSLNRSPISWMSVRFSLERLPSTSSNTLSSVTSVPTGLRGHGRPLGDEHLVGLLDDRPVAAAVMPGRTGLEPDARHDPDAEVDVVRRVRVELDEIGLGDLGAAGRPLQPQGGVERPLVVGEELLEGGDRPSGPAHFYDDLVNFAALRPSGLTWYTVHRVVNETRWPEVGDGEHPQQAGRDRGLLLHPGGSPLPHQPAASRCPASWSSPSWRSSPAPPGPPPSPAGPSARRTSSSGLLDLPNGIPGKDVFRRVLMMLKPEAFEAAFNAWIARLRDEATAETGVDRPIIAIDGKTARRSHDAKKDLGPLHVVTAWAGEYGLALGQQVCAEKSNEITAIPELLKKIDVRGGIVTIDAMGAQKAIAEEIIGGKADYVLALKRNHESLHAAVIEHIDERLEGDLEDGPGADDDRSRARPRGGADLPATAGPRGPAGQGRVEGAEVGRRGDVAAEGGRGGEHRGPLLPQQPAGGRGPVRPGGARPLVGGERVPLDPRRDVPRGRLADPRAGAGGEHHLALPLHPLDPQAAPRPAA